MCPGPELFCYSINLTLPFRGLTERQGLLWCGSAGWAEWSPFLDYSGAELVPWLRAAQEAADIGWPDPIRQRIEVNCTVPAIGPDDAAALVGASGCRTAKVKVAAREQTLADDLARLEAVRDALGPAGRLRIDANGAWDTDQALAAIRELDRFDLEYVEQPCPTVSELADLRRRLSSERLHVPIAADESIRRASDPLRVASEQAADVAVLKVQPLGGVRACLEIAERIGLPVVVSSALETSVGLRAGLALAAALPELPYACGLNTAELLADDVVFDPLRARDGFLDVPALDVTALEVDPASLQRTAANPDDQMFWQARLMHTEALARSG
jgi:o-succinylbenzoate synthase